MDKSQITKQRRSLDVDERRDNRSSGYRRDYNDENRHSVPRTDFTFRGGMPSKARKERSLSPYSKRLALTQAMNM